MHDGGGAGERERAVTRAFRPGKKQVGGLINDFYSICTPNKKTHTLLDDVNQY